MHVPNVCSGPLDSDTVVAVYSAIEGDGNDGAGNGSVHWEGWHDSDLDVR